ncbi:MAG: respiratory nitrate reductase subunit gamma [Acetobacteraceae bacterium SCN 69-10]|nr:respiratory nitrate reductase subunit gamma [Rhodospirillales bacterium]ODU62427.1 MAG: respiratory nitrate reductase subunit gamma [Acetobacteraceae bacterium SCN 69-10]OJY70579.1 MAG: respiratory nitrate reductase subunit gamma [Rhodospirillales bacterium 70-18]
MLPHAEAREMLNSILFGLYPYVAIAVFLAGSLIRFDREQYTWRSGSSQLLQRKMLMWGSNCFHVGVLAILAGHFVGLLTPHEWYTGLGLSVPNKQLLAMAAGGVFGLVCLLGITLLVMRRLGDARIRATSSPMDIAILLMLFAQLLLGLSSIFVSAQHLDGAEMLKLAGWAQHIVTLQTDAAGLMADVHPIFKLHILLGLTIFLVFPFSRLVHIWSVPLGYIGRSYQVVRRRGGPAAVRVPGRGR